MKACESFKVFKLSGFWFCSHVQDATQTTQESPRLFAIGLIVLVVAVFAIFSPTLRSPLAFDDDAAVTFAKSFTSWKDIFGPDAFRLFRPVKNLHSWILVKADAGLPLWHSINLAAYALAACSVANLVKRLTGSARWGLAAGAMWAFSTTGVTVAVWASCFNISLAVAAASMALALQDRNAELDRGLGWKIAAASCWLLALLSYETAVAFAPMVVVLEWVRGRRVFSKAAWGRHACFFVAGLIWFSLRVTSGSHFQGFASNPAILPSTQPWQLAVSAPYFLWTHLLMWVAPWGRIEFMSSYVWDVSVPAIVHPFCWLLLGALVLVIFALKKRSPMAAFGLAWFLIASIPSGNFVPLGNTPFADYYVPFPSIGLVLVMVILLRGLLSIRRDDTVNQSTRNFAMVVACALVVGRTAQLVPMWGLIEMWKSPMLVITNACTVRPQQFLAKSIIALRMATQGQLELAEPFAREAIAEGPHLAAPRMVLGDIDDKAGRTEEAIKGFESALVLMHTDFRTSEYCSLRLGQLHGKNVGQLDQAMWYLLPVLKRHASDYHEDAVIAAAKALDLNGKHDQALDAVRKGLTYHQDSPALLDELKRLETPPGKS